MNNLNSKSPHLFKSSNKKCTECNQLSSTVNKSTKFNRNLCIDCLYKIILESLFSNNPSKDPD